MSSATVSRICGQAWKNRMSSSSPEAMPCQGLMGSLVLGAMIGNGAVTSASA